MKSPMARAKRLWEKRTGQEDFSSLLVVETYENKEDGFFAEIKSNGWISLNDDACGEGLSGSPEHIERFCKWYLGIKA